MWSLDLPRIAQGLFKVSVVLVWLFLAYAFFYGVTQ